MWDNPRLLNMAAGALVGVAVFVLGIAGFLLLARSERFPVREVDVVGAPLQKTSKSDIEAAVQARLRGNFFATSPDDLRGALEQLPWVRSASVRRIWPDTFEVQLEEHVAFARWGGDALVDIYGEKFPGRTTQVLPQLSGPDGMESEVTKRYINFSKIAAPLGAPLERVVLTARFAWQLRLANGLNIMLGRDADAAEGRLRRFVEVFDSTAGIINKKNEYVDLRYPNGFALRVTDSKGL
jgi:cell division protein FtsQ